MGKIPGIPFRPGSVSDSHLDSLLFCIVHLPTLGRIARDCALYFMIAYAFTKLKSFFFLVRSATMLGKFPATSPCNKSRELGYSQELVVFVKNLATGTCGLSHEFILD